MTTMTNDSAALDADGSLMLLANDLLYKAFEMRCSDFNVEPDKEQVVLRYLVNRETIKEMQLPKDVHSELVFCYKALAGLNIQQSDRPQDKKATIPIGGKDIVIRVTAIPGEYGETIAVSFKFPD
jgi:type II secretory ATPase GspE/PulE/Tfp pilus assembly ATPase PilB-like protein